MPVKILIADDNASIRKGIGILLAKSKPQWLAEEASNGAEAIQMAVTHKPDIVLLDVSMPLIDGLEAATRIAKLNLPSRVILLTAQDPALMTEVLQKVGAQDCVDKSNIVSHLIPAIDRALAPAITAP